MPIYLVRDTKAVTEVVAVTVIADNETDAREIAAQETGEFNADEWRNNTTDITLTDLGTPHDPTPRVIQFTPFPV